MGQLSSSPALAQAGFEAHDQAVIMRTGKPMRATVCPATANIQYVCRIGAGLLLALSATLAAADSPRPRWEWGLGIATATLRDYPGSRNYRTHVPPYPWLVYRSDRLYLGREGSRGILWRGIDSELDASLSLNPSVHQKDNPERAGMPAADTTLGLGLRERITLWRDEASDWRLNAQLPLRMNFALRDGGLDPVGVQFQPGLSLDHKLSGAWSWGVGASISIADSDYHDYFYGVAPAYATARRSAYSASGGFGGWQLNSRISYQHEPHRVSVYIRIEGLEGATFADSPLVSTLHAGTIGLTWAYQFGASRKMVSSDNP